MHIKLEDVISHAILIFVVVSYLQQLNKPKKKRCAIICIKALGAAELSLV